MPLVSRAPTASSGIPLCPFHLDICAKIHQVVQDLDDGIRVQPRIQNQPGQNASQLHNGASRGCYICITFLSRAPQSYRNGVETNNLRPPHHQDGVVNSYGYHVLGRIDRNIAMSVYYHSAAPPRSPWGGISTAGWKAEYAQIFRILPAGDVYVPDGVEFAESTESEATGEQINEWLQICMESHDKCKKPPAMWGEFPSRLVAVEHDKIKVKYTDEIDRSENYVALSYCWGENKNLKLTDSKKDPLYSGIHISALPMTFIDAILATRAMGKKYIWIDSLCVVQVPELDKSEGSHMDEIYANAWCTIAATHGTHNRAGCFVTRDPRLLQPPTYNSPVGQEQFCIIDDNLWDSAITNAPLNKRGWVLQERLLSPRTVHFCAEQVFWECAELVACESFPEGIPEQSAGQRPDGKRIPENQYKVYLNETPRTSSVAYDRWYLIVQEYSRRALKKEIDKLFAISGVARKLLSTRNDQPVAGLWYDDLPFGLAWSRAGHILGKRPETYVAPSWSWASLEGEVEFPKQSEKSESWVIMTTVMGCTTSPTNTPFGPLKSAALTLRGPLLPLTVFQDNQQTSPRRPHPGWIMLGRMQFLADMVTWDVRPLAQFIGVQLHFTPLVYGNGVAAKGADVVVGLVLEPFHGKMRRVGLLFTVVRPGDQILEAISHLERFSLPEIVVV